MADATSTTPGDSVLIDHWPTVLWRSAANWAAWIAVLLPDILAWVLSHLDAVPQNLLTPEARNITRIILVSVAVPVARIVKQRTMQRVLDEKTAANASPPPAPLRG